jgi:hypothetical protein
MANVEPKQQLLECPSCGGGLPVVSKICDYCGYELLEMVESRYTPESLQSMIAQSMERMRSGLRTGFFRILLRNYYIALPVSAFLAMLSIPAAKDDQLPTAVFLALSGLALVAILVKVIRVALKRDKRLPLNLYRAQIDQYARIARAFYGDDARIRQVLGAFRAEVGRLYDRQGRIETRAFIVLTVLLLAFVSVAVKLIRERAFVPEEVANAPWVERYDSARWTVRAQGVEGPLGDYLEVVPGPYPAWIRLRSNESFSGGEVVVGNVKLRTTKPLAGAPGTPALTAVLEDGGGHVIGRFEAERADRLEAGLRHGAGELFVTFRDASAAYLDDSVMEALLRSGRLRIASSLDERGR